MNAYLKVSTHSMRLARACLSVREARRHAALEYRLHQRLRRIPGMEIKKENNIWNSTYLATRLS